MKKYKLLYSGKIFNNETNKELSFSPEDLNEYNEWIFQGNSPDYESPKEPSIPKQKMIVRNWWEYSLDFDYNHPLLKQFATMMNISENALKNIFIEASRL